jgi:hypothetical protein
MAWARSRAAVSTDSSGTAGQAEGGSQKGGSTPAVVRDPGVALELADAARIERAHSPHFPHQSVGKASDGSSVGGAISTRLPPSVFAV